jgi:hypothetical protein
VQACTTAAQRRTTQSGTANLEDYSGSSRRALSSDVQPCTVVEKESRDAVHQLGITAAAALSGAEDPPSSERTEGGWSSGTHTLQQGAAPEFAWRTAEAEEG